MTDRERHRLLFAPYKPPPFRRGDRAFCLARDCDVVITSWTDARISWPRCRALGTQGGSGILVDEVLAFAVRHESAVAIRYRWGIGTKTMAWWRRVLSLGRADPEGSRRLIEAAAKAGAAVLKRDGLSDAVCNKHSEISKQLNLIRFPRAKPAITSWTKAESRLLAQEFDDAEVAHAIGRSETAVRVMRWRLERGQQMPGANSGEEVT